MLLSLILTSILQQDPLPPTSSSWASTIRRPQGAAQRDRPDADAVDRGLGQHIKIEMGCEMDAWLENDENLALWEGDDGFDGAKLTASDRRILLANWYYRATVKALKGHAKWAYFQHAGALLTADGSDDDLSKLEGTPPGYKLVVPAPDN